MPVAARRATQRRDDVRASLDHQPALDGLRAVAVTAVLLFHGGASWLPAGYLGVSVFFTLSGFLITALLLREVAATGSVRIGAFYARRARRLLPASLLCLAGIVAGASAGAFVGVAHLRRDVLGALLQVANWVDLAAGESYGDLLQAQAGQASPVAHYWSLAIEEQFYWLWPLVVAGLARRSRPGGWSRWTGRATLVAAAVAPLVAAVWGPDAAYWATPARAAEILAGATLASLWFEGRLRWPPRWVAPAAGAALLAAAGLLPATGGPAYAGGLPLVAVASAALIYGVQVPGPVRSLLSARPLVGLGQISYGVYLYHWPLFAWLDARTVGLDGGALLAVRLAATLAVALLSFALVEQPVRRAQWRPAKTLLGAAPALGAVAALGLVLLPEVSTDFGPDEASAAAAAIRPVAPAPSTGATVAGRTVDAPARIMVVGDSTALALGAGLVEWAVANPDRAQVTVRAGQGCGFVRSGTVPTDPPGSWPAACDRLFAALPADLARDQPEVVLLYVSSRDLDSRSFDGGAVLSIRDPVFQRHVAEDYRAITQLILATTPATVVWVRPPVADPYWRGEHEVFHNPEMHAILDEVREQVVAEHTDRVALLDLRQWMERTGWATDRGARPDGIHLTVDAALELTDRWLGPELVAVARAEAEGP